MSSNFSCVPNTKVMNLFGMIFQSILIVNIFPDFGRRILASCFGTEIFPVLQNKTFYVRLNIKSNAWKLRNLLSKTNKIMN